MEAPDQAGQILARASASQTSAIRSVRLLEMEDRMNLDLLVATTVAGRHQGTAEEHFVRRSSVWLLRSASVNSANTRQNW